MSSAVFAAFSLARWLRLVAPLFSPQKRRRHVEKWKDEGSLLEPPLFFLAFLMDMPDYFIFKLS